MEANSLSIIVAGSGGAGAISTGTMLLEAAGLAGWHAYLTRSVGAQIRGGEAVAQLRISRDPLASHEEHFHVMLALDWKNLGKFSAEMPLAPQSLVARTVGESWHRVHAICARYVELAVAAADLSEMTAVAIDETSCRRGHNYLTLAADAEERKVVFVTEGKDAETIERLDRDRLPASQRADLDALIAQVTTKRTARAWLYREQLREILERKQINVVSAMLAQWCTNVMRSKVEPMKEVARLIRTPFDGIVAWTQTRQTNGFLEALNGLFQAAKRKARGYTRFATMRTVLFLIAGKLDFARINSHAA